MKKIFLVTILILLFSCSLHKHKGQKSNNDSNLSETEKAIINDFLDGELKKERYLSYKDFEIVIIEEALKKIKPLSVYEFNLKYKTSWGMSINHWILNSLQVKKLKKVVENEKVYHWKTIDFKNMKVNTLKYEELNKMINSGMLFYDANRLVIYLSRPLVIDDDNAFLSYEIDNCKYLCNNITHFTVLLKKENNKWIEKEYYEDGVYY